MAVEGYSRGQIALHWAVALLVALQFLFSDGIKRAFELGIEAGGAAAGGLAPSGPAIAHMAGGGLVLLLAFLRLMIRQSRGAPAPPATDPPWQRAVTRAVHAALYALLVAIPVAGALAWGGASEAAGQAHGALTKLLFALVVLHVAGALYGHFVQQTGVIGRMVKSRD
jgi:cytochrome b561